MDKRNKLINTMLDRGYSLIEDDVYHIAQRLQKYDKDLCLFFNPYRGAYEIHTPLYSPSYCVSNEHCDYELLLKLKRADNRTEYGFREKMDEIDKEQELKEIRDEKRFEDLKRDVIRQVERKFRT